MMKWTLLLLLCFSILFSWDFHDKTIGEYTFEWDRAKDFPEAAEVFLDSFLVAYRGFSPQELGVESIEGFLKEVIQEELSLIEANSEEVHWLIAKKGEEVIGFFILELTQYPEVYGRQLAISPHYFRKGIGRLMAQVVLENLPDATRFVAITRSVNQVSARFFESIGFQSVDYMHEGYDSTKYIGFEYFPN